MAFAIPSEYKEFLLEAGFAAVGEMVERRAVERDIKQALADRFRGFDDDDLFTQGATIVARPSATSIPPEERRDRI